jgi:predicted N-acetyltransferase YhbS
LKVEIRYLEDNPEIISTVAKWIYEEWGRLVKGRTLETAHVKVRQALNSRKIPLTLVAFLDNKPVGTVSIDTEDMSTHPELTPWMASVYVDTAYRKRGVGSALCERIKEDFRRLGVKTAYLFTPDQEKLYAGLGWKTISREGYRGEDVVIMRLDFD